MKALTLAGFLPAQSDYAELRAGENTSEAIRILNGSVVANTISKQSGVCARVYEKGGWGFSSSPEQTGEGIRAVIDAATENARFMSGKLLQPSQRLSGRPALISCDQRSGAKQPSQKDKLDFSRQLDAYIEKKYPSLMSRIVILNGFNQERRLITSDGSEYYSYVPRTHVFISMTVDKDGQPIDLIDTSCGGLQEFDAVCGNIEKLYAVADGLYETLMKKREGAFPQSGVKECILAPDLAGILAHEAVGHTVEYDLVRGGSVAGDLLGKRVASDLVSMTDFAHHAFGSICPVPIFIDDEGVEARDAALIENGILKGYMHNRQTAASIGVEPDGNARAFGFDDEPLIRMRNTCILPGKSKLEDMIASVEDGYYLTMPTNGQADLTGEFMFGVDMGYEIKGGRLGRAILSTTVSGVAFEMLKSVTAVSDDMVWISSGFCGKKQRASVGMGGPAIKCKINLGGK